MLRRAEIPLTRLTRSTRSFPAMRSTRFALLCIALAATAVSTWAQGLPAASPESVGMSTERLKRIGVALKGEIDKGNLPGVVVMVARKGKLVYTESLGSLDKAANTPMTKDAIFRIYSMTKPLASVAAMTLVEEGKMQLTDPVSKFLPAMKNLMVSVPLADSTFARVTYSQVPQAREMTVQDLLRHTAGLAYGEITQNAPVKEAYAKAGMYLQGVRDYDSRALTPQEEVERLAKAPLAHQPGTVWEYSVAVDVLGRVVEAASGERLADLMDKRIFKPLKMNDSAFWVPPEKMSRVAQPLAVDLPSGQPINVIDVSAQPKNDSGGAGGVSTAADYLRFAQMLLQGGKLDDVRILSRSTVQLMTSDHLGTRIAAPVSPGELLLGTPGYTFGLGFMVRQGNGVAGVAGSQGEFMWAGYAGTFFWVDPKEELVAVFMSQAPSPVRAYYRRMVKNLTYQAIVD